VGRPPFLYLDEPTTGLDPASRRDLWSMIRGLVSDGTTVLLTTQYLDEADQLADEIVVIDHGKVIAAGTSKDLKMRVGGQVVFAQPVDPRDVPTTGRVLEPFARDDDAIRIDAEAVTVSIADGVQLGQVARRLDDEGIQMDELALRRPSLDEVFLAFTPAIAINVDFQRGVIDRFRSLPIARSAVIAGRITADGFRVAWSVLLITGFGLFLGFRFGGTVIEAIAALIVVIAFGLTMCWPMALIGITARTTESVNTWGFLIILPLTFVSSAFVPPETMPGWLQDFAQWNPVTAVIDAARRLMLG